MEAAGAPRSGGAADRGNGGSTLGPVRATGSCSRHGAVRRVAAMGLRQHHGPGTTSLAQLWVEQGPGPPP